jgi:hypothetical protein
MSMRDIIAILVVLLTVWGGISRAIDRAAKKRRQQEMMRQRALEAAGEGVATQPAPVPMRAGRAIEQPRPDDDLAARRRAQLEELRQRRMGRQTAAVPPTIPPQQATARPGQSPSRGAVLRPQQQRPVIGPVTMSPGPQGRQKSPQDIRAIEASAAAWRRQQELEARRRREEQARKQAQEKEAAEQQAAEAARQQALRESRTPARVTRRSGIREIVEAERGSQADRSVALAAAGLGVSSLADSLRSANLAQRAIILKEILDPPLALRRVDQPL